MQNAKIVDTKRSYVPVDPNTFPENYLSTQKEDSPEESPSVVPYMGDNFLPTAYGYKSFFGTNFKANISALAAEPEYVFIFQTLTYGNVLVALCNTGIWAKVADTVGAWTQLNVLVPPAGDVYYEWFYTIIKNKLYAFRGNGTAYYLIETDIGEPTGISSTAVVPSFINIGAQLGMFRLGGRLGFWDAENAIGWSSPDDLSDFTPDVLTGANVTTFNSIVGKISAIRPMGRHAVVYSSKSIVLLEINPAETFLVKAEPITQTGVTYARQSVESVPNTTHYCYSSSGILKIENGKADVIIPEVFDFFKKQFTTPVYLKLLQGRFLAFELMDAAAMAGIPIFSQNFIDPGILTFPGSNSLEGYSQMLPEDINFCQLMQQIDQGKTAEQDAAATAQLPDKKPGTFAEPIWTCYISNTGLKDISNLAWDSTPCGAVAYDATVWHMSPDLAGSNRLDGMTTDGTNKTAKTGDQAYLDGKWTMERFLQYQTAIWNMEEAVVAELNSQIANRAFNKSQTLNDQTSCVISNPAETVCNIGEFVSEFSPHYFGYNACSFWLTRFATQTKEYATHSKTTRQCNDPGDQPLAHIGFIHHTEGTSDNDRTVYGSAAAALASIALTGLSLVPRDNPGPHGGGLTVDYITTHGIYWADGSPPQVMDNNDIRAKYVTSAGKVTNGMLTPGVAGSAPVLKETYIAGHVDLTDTSYANNQVEATNNGIIGVETAWCEITGWRYTKNDGTTAISASTACTDETNKFPGNPPTATERTADPALSYPLLINPDGSVCNFSFLQPLDNNVTWPAQTLNYPAGDFLFQDGSIAPRWPTMYGAYIYDLHLKKWGKFNGEYKQLLDYFPVNSESTPPIVTINQGMLAGVLKADGFIYLFDDNPAVSSLTWGKIGYYRRGVTDLQEVLFKFAQPATGSIKIDYSLDGKRIITELAQTEAHADVVDKAVYPLYNAKWFNVSITGRFDVTDLQVRGLTKGQR